MTKPQAASKFKAGDYICRAGTVDDVYFVSAVYISEGLYSLVRPDESKQTMSIPTVDAEFTSNQHAKNEFKFQVKLLNKDADEAARRDLDEAEYGE